jgi:hypothetical protein
MSKKFTYTKITGHYYCKHSDDWEKYGVDFDYEVDNYKLLPKVVDLVFKDYFGECNEKEAVKTALANFIDEHDLVETLADNYEDTLKEMFKDSAMEWYEG